MKRIVILIAVALMTVIIPCGGVLALDEPTTVSLDDIEIFTDILYTGDFLAIVPYQVSFTTEPDVEIDETFIFSVMDGATENGTALAYPRYTGGYGYGMVSFYFQEGMTWDYAYTFRVRENPTYYPTSQYWDFAIGESNYSDDTDQILALKAKVIDVADDLSTQYSVSLLSSNDAGGLVLSTYGEIYFLNTIPGLQTMCPELFAVQLESPSYTKRSWSYTLATSLQTKYAGTFIGDFMTGFAGLFSTETSSAMNIMSIMLFVVLIGISAWKFKASMMSGFIDGYALLLLLMLNGMFSLIWAGFMAFVGVVAGGIVLFFNKG